ncbi:hypothetical protein [Methylobacterium frigidaeris]|uniref:Tetratricopeptide repeat protein n=1 Tax=Methylobacterium frigidaeris TaxID=2038277 RepID=A0AA37H9T3_9HYPH|nr:hypothetical protein [Methylobacterium frigidaeris]PIK71048.1 hypothetical protein CS379_21450 [Methylobacterium frigidaeris]GJD61904.1 hypothetical protein MPEAHAMD_2053 [Methylobacterium frigidaeris]
MSASRSTPRRPGGSRPGGWIIILPPLGGIASIRIEILPELLGSPRGERDRRAIAHGVNPEKTCRILRGRLADADTVANPALFAEECVALGKWQEAWEQYDEIVRRPNGNEPVFHLAHAEADLELGRFAESLAGLDALRVREPDYDSPRGHMLYARTLAAFGRTDEARDAFEAISQHDHSFEARARLAASRGNGAASPRTSCAGPERSPDQRFAVVTGEAMPLSATQARPSWPSRFT